jgi:glucose-1-phosphate thymidylyltransferase
MKGIVLAGGSGTRLFPATRSISKQLLCVYDKPMVYYPISVLMLAGISEILVITTNEDINRYKNLLNDGSEFGLKITYEIQENPNGLAEAFIIGEKFIQDDDVCLILGDNIFYGQGLTQILIESRKKVETLKKAVVFGYNVPNPKDFGVVEFDKHGNIISIEEKPENPKSDYAVVGLYFYPNSVLKKAKSVTPSHRGELEISSLNQLFIDEKKLSVTLLRRGFSWFDTGTHDSILQASNFVSSVEKNTGLKVACLEEIALTQGFINKEEIAKSLNFKNKNSYGNYLRKLHEE